MDVDYLHSFRHRMQSRLAQVKSISEELERDKKNALELLKQFGGYFGTSEEVHKYRLEIDSLGISTIDVIDDLVDELEIIEKFSWQYIVEIQEKCTSLILSAYEEPLRLKAINEYIMGRLLESVRQYLKASGTSSQSEPSTVDCLENYSTPSLEAMRTAIEHFWLGYDIDKPPTQKAVSNFIAEQLGKPIRDRFTDELARAIKPE